MNKLLTIDQAAELLQVNRETVRKFLKSGRLKGHKLAGWLWRIREDDLERFIAQDNNGEAKS